MLEGWRHVEIQEIKLKKETTKRNLGNFKPITTAI